MPRDGRRLVFKGKSEENVLLSENSDSRALFENRYEGQSFATEVPLLKSIGSDGEYQYNGHFKQKRFRICLVSDFFFPNFGGVETHIWCLAQCLIQRGHRVIVVTHRYKDRCGVRIMTNSLKVYYLPLTVVYDQVILPTLSSFFPLFRDILARENIQIVHGHQCVSVMALESLLFARSLGYRTCFTDHSLFGFNDVASIHINKFLEMVLSDVDHVIGVSHACRENLSLRARLHPNFISAIPNAVDATKFAPTLVTGHGNSSSNSNSHLNSNLTQVQFPSTGSNNSDVVNNSGDRKKRITIVVLSRLVFRKGIDLLVKIIPDVCARVDYVQFLIGGDGPKLLLLEEMRERYQLHDRVELLGAVPHDEVRSVLSRGHLFLNCSLTESFCIALLEAAACGLFVVSTKVGGVPEVLPTSMIRFADPVPDSLVAAILDGVRRCHNIDPNELHDCVAAMYSWMDVSRRIESIYEHVVTLKKPTLMKRMLRYLSLGRVSGCIAVVLMVLLEGYRMLLDFVFPLHEVESTAESQWESSNGACFYR